MEVVAEADVESTDAVTGVHLKILAGGENENVQHFVIDPGAVIPEHSHPHEQVGYVIKGTLTFTVPGEEIVVTEGDSYVIPGGESHKAVNEGDLEVVGLDIFSPPRDNPDWQD